MLTDQRFTVMTVIIHCVASYLMPFTGGPECRKVQGLMRLLTCKSLNTIYHIKKVLGMDRILIGWIRGAGWRLQRLVHGV